MERLTTRKGGLAIVIDHFKFRKHKTTKNTIAWCCCVSSCHSRCSTDPEVQSLKRQPTPHNHQPDFEALKQERVRESVKRRATEDINERPSKIVCSETRDQEGTNLRDMKNLKECIYRARLKLRPSLPKNKQDVFDALSQYDMSNGSIQMYEADRDSGIIMFSSPANINFFQQSPKIFADGTFKYCPKFFYQLYTIHGYNNGVYAPCIFFILPNKTKVTYVKMLQMVTKHVDTSAIKTITVDLEVAMHQAIADIMPSLEIKACQFHVTQAWLRKIQNLGLIISYKKSQSEHGKWLRSFFGLPLLAPEYVEDAFVFNIMADAPIHGKCIDFSTYVLKNFIASTEDTTPQFPPTMWCSSENGNTTNNCESFHSYFGDHFPKAHPDIFTFIRGLNIEQEYTQMKINSSTTPGSIPKRPRTTKRHKKCPSRPRSKRKGVTSRAERIARAARLTSRLAQIDV